ncbi:MAG: hypothetical protein KKE16_03215 [Firmicutes bacterium]|nr:hypothetical protein [Bacillota bacterium]
MSSKFKLAERIVYASRASRIAKASRLGIIVSAVLTFLIFAISYYGETVGNFTFSVDRLAYNAGISMYEDETENPDYTTRLVSVRVDNADGMTALCGTEYSQFPVGTDLCIPSDEFAGSVDGANNLPSVLIYTFYIENSGDAPVDLESNLVVQSATKGAEEAIRVRVIIDGVGTTYAKRQSSRGAIPGSLEPLTHQFYDLTTVMHDQYAYFDIDQVMKITVMVWYEGEDADHNLNIVGGGVKLDMKFTITRIYGEDDY